MIKRAIVHSHPRYSMNYSAYIPIHFPNSEDHDNQSLLWDSTSSPTNTETQTNGHFNGCHNSNDQSTTPNQNSNGKLLVDKENKKHPYTMNQANTMSHINNNQMSMASIALQKQLDATVKAVLTGEDKENAPASFLSAQLQFKNDGGKWGVLVAGEDAAAVEAVKSEVMRTTPKLLSPGLISAEEEECEFENVALFDDDDFTDPTTNNTFASILSNTASATATVNTVTIATSSSIVFKAEFHRNLLLGPKHHLLMKALRDHDCIISFSTPANELGLSNEKGLPLLTARQERLLQAGPFPQAKVLIPADKIDWLWLSGQMRHLEETLWRYGASLIEESGDCYCLTALSGALLNKCLDTLQQSLTAHQSITLLFACRDDLRDYPSSLQSTLQQAAHTLSCTIKHTPLPQSCQMAVEIAGAAEDIARMAIRLQSLPLEYPDTRLIERKLSLQVPADIKDFICGKKDGKFVRIMKETGVDIQLHECEGTESLFIQLIEVAQLGHPSQLPMAGQLLQGELPAQLTFHVPETHHKRMIGHGGKAIQRIMKKWGVYVKFMNSFEASQLFNYSDPFHHSTSNNLDVVDNVIVKTPGKNSAALQAIKEEIFALDDGQQALVALQKRAISRASIPNVQIDALKRALANPDLHQNIQLSLQDRTLWLESSSGNSYLKAFIDSFAALSETDCAVTRSPTLQSASDDAFKHFPSALFVQSHASLSASGSPLLSEERWIDCDDEECWEGETSPAPSATSSVPMNSLSSSPSLLPVGSKESLGDDEVDGMIASIANKRQFWIKF